MKQSRIMLAMIVLGIASLACSALAGGKTNATAPANSSSGNQAGSPSTSDNGGGSNIKSNFPVTADASNFTDMGDGSILFYTKMSQADVLKFYRDAYAAKGYKERTVNTSISDTTFSMVFDGDPSGKAIVIQSVNLGNGSSTVAIRLEALP
jgi:hypothetical protein